LVLDQNGHCLGLNVSIEPLASSYQNSTRRAGGRKEIEKEMQVCDSVLSIQDELFFSSQFL